jgi:hypothetical protein
VDHGRKEGNIAHFGQLAEIIVRTGDLL